MKACLRLVAAVSGAALFVAPAVAAQCVAGNAGSCAAPAILPARRDSAARALADGMMDLAATGIDRFAAAHPIWDGRGVLIAILDSGTDPGLPGLGEAADGSSKVLDLRDFSGEGRVVLHRIARKGDTLVIGTHHLLGANAITIGAGEQALWGGVVIEAALGKVPAADLNGNGTVDDTLPVVVARTASGWALYADTRGSGSLSGTAPVHDFALAHEYFGWHQRTANGASLLPASIDIAANISDSAGVPLLDLFFDTSSHGTHVAGIAAGHDLYGVSGFDGVAPGAKIIGLKIADDAHGAVSVTGSMVHALEYAIRFAHDHSLPLVVNLSFGVGNEVEGTARIDAIVDSILAAHPEVVMTVAAGNDGPGLSTLGFPGSAGRVVSVGATLPLVFMGAPRGYHGIDPVAPFSSRGGEHAGPDIVTPGAAYSLVPNFAIGQEQEEGTSMAAPYAAGMAARLISALQAAHRSVPGYVIAQALRVAAHPIPGMTAVDEGAGQPDLNAAWQWLANPHDVAQLGIDVGPVAGRGGVYLTVGSGALGTRVRVRQLGGAPLSAVTLRADFAWIEVPESVVLRDGSAEFTVQVRATAAVNPGVISGAITVTGPDEAAGPLAIIPVVVRKAVSPGTRVPVTLTVAPSAVGRVFVATDTGRGLQIAVATIAPAQQAQVALHEPGGMPFRDGGDAVAAPGAGAALFDVAGNDAVAGLYEVDVVAGPVAPLAAQVTVHVAPLRLGVKASHDTLQVLAQNLGATALNVRLRAGLLGAERTIQVAGHGGGAVRIVLPVPRWAVKMNADTRMAPLAWSRFTDFGVSFLDKRGYEFDTHPINYAFSRAAIELPDSVRGDSMTVLFTPGFADMNDQADWTLDLEVHYYVDKPYSLDAGGSSVKPVAAAGVRRESFVQSALPIAIPVDFLPLLTIVALEGDNDIWTRELTIPRPIGTAP